jgi:hypothetical protein
VNSNPIRAAAKDPGLANGLAAAIVIQKTRRDRITAAGLSAGVISIFVAAVVALNYSVFGSFWSAYDKVLRGIGVGSYPLAWKLHLLFLDGSPVFHETEPMLVNHYPWLLCCLPGIIILVGRFGIGGLGLLPTIGATFILYLEYNDFWPSNVFRYQLVHYLVWALPLLALIAYAGLRDCWKLRVTRWSLLSIPASFLWPQVPTLWRIAFHQSRSEVLGRSRLPTPRQADQTGFFSPVLPRRHKWSRTAGR